MSDLRIECEWLEPIAAPAEVSATSALISVQVGEEVLTRVRNDFSRSTMDRVVLSAYPLALWLAESWWRLRWETAPTSAASMAWRMAHEMPAAGFGFIWPCISFESVDEVIRVVAKAPSTAEFESVQYLTRGEYWVSADDFEVSMGQFVETACERLLDSGIRTSDLQELWAEVKGELASEALSQVRRVEAMLGFDAGQAPNRLIDAFDRVVQISGRAARDEVAHALSSSHNPEELLDSVIAVGNRPSVIGRLETIPIGDLPQSKLPWQRGYDLARQARKAIGKIQGPLSDEGLGELLGLRAQEVAKGEAFQGSKVGLAVREDGQTLFAFRKPEGPRRRFEAARIISDHILAPSGEPWLVETDSKSSRQQTQRAFAAEFLAPIDSLVDVLGGDYSDERIEEASDMFGVAEVAIRRHLVNNRPEGMPYINAY